MYTALHAFTQRPAPFSLYTSSALWTRPHVARQMLAFHLDRENDLASRSAAGIDAIVDWIDDRVQLKDKAVCDLGCGPGLYAARFADRGAGVTGIDFSQHSLDHARAQAAQDGQDIRYLHADYTADPLPAGFDLVTLIYYDFGVLSPEQRSTLLARIHDMLNPGGYLILDVLGMGSWKEVAEKSSIEENLMGGFWSEGPYVGMQKTLRYEDDAVSLDRYLIVEPDGQWEIYNWFQYFTPEQLSDEIAAAGFSVETTAGSLSGEPLEDDAPTIGVVARRT